MNNRIIKSVCVLAVVALCAGVAFAGCGTKETTEGTLKAVDADKKTVVVATGDKEVTMTLTAGTKVTDSEGNKVELASLVGKGVKVVSEHSKVDSVQQTG